MLHTSRVPETRSCGREGADPAVRLAAVRRSGSSSGSPGRRFEYHGVSAHWVLAELIERLAGSDFRDYVEAARVRRRSGCRVCSGIPLGAQDECVAAVAVERWFGARPGSRPH